MSKIVTPVQAPVVIAETALDKTAKKVATIALSKNSSPNARKAAEALLRKFREISPRLS